MKVFSAFLILWGLQAQAEYRMFLLDIRAADGTLIRQELSTLDPDQYPGYHPLKQGEFVTYSDTWMCRGRTSHLPPCKSPRQIAAEAQESQSSPP